MTEERIASALERIAAALEELAGTPRVAPPRRRAAAPRPANDEAPEVDDLTRRKARRALERLGIG